MIGSYISVLQRRLGAILLLTALLAPVAFLALTAGGRTYESTAVVQIGSNLAADVVGLDTGYEDPETRLATEMEILESSAVAERAQETLAAQGWTESAEEFSERLSVVPRGVSNLLDVIGSDPDPQRAEQLTAAFAGAYVDYRREMQRTAVESVVEGLEEQLQAAEADLAALELPPVPSAAAQREAAAARSWYDTLSDRVEQARLRLSVDTSGVALRTPASPAELVQGMSTAVAVPLSLIGAFLLACGAAFLVDLLRDPVRTREEALSLVAAPSLGELPRPRRGKRPALGLTDPASPVATAARGVRLRLERLLATAPRTTVITASPSDADDAVLVAASLAAAWSRTDRRVALIADLGPDRLAAVPELRPSDASVEIGEGLTVWATSIGGVWVGPATGGATGGRGFLEHPSPSAALAALHEVFDVVVMVDAASQALDTAAVEHLTDATVVVCALGRTPAGRLKSLVRTLEEYGARVDGVVLTRPSKARRAAPAPRASTAARAAHLESSREGAVAATAAHPAEDHVRTGPSSAS